MRCTGTSSRDEIHYPAQHDRSTDKQRKAVGPMPHHEPRLVALRNAEDNRSEQREQHHRREVGGPEHQSDFLPVLRLCASTAAITFSNPATTMKRVPQSAVVTCTESAPRLMARLMM